MVFLRDDNVTDMLKDYFFMDEFVEWSTPEILAEIKDHESKAKSREYDKVYANARDKRLAKKFREILRRMGLTDFGDQRLMWEYLRDKNAGFTGGPASWVKLNIQDDTVVGTERGFSMFTDLDMPGSPSGDENEMTFSSIIGQA